MPEPGKPVVSALVVSRNAKDELLRCLKTFFASADVPVEAVVVDNDSSDGSPAAVADEFPQATVLVQSKNLGYGRDYQYAHDVEGKVADMQSLPDNLRDRTYYHPTDQGIEKRIRERMGEIRKLRQPKSGRTKRESET